LGRAARPRIIGASRPAAAGVAALTVAYDLRVGALFVPVLCAMLWRRGGRPGALASIAVGGAAVVALLFIGGIDSDVPICGGLGLSLSVYLAFSLFDRSERRAVGEAA
jgi:SSS family solute:Na+ symporter